MYLSPAKRVSALRDDIRSDRARATAGPDDEGGGDFYGPFWADAKAHVFGQGNLHDLVQERIALNWRRRDLYPRLRDGFLLWWDERRRWTNQPFQPGRVVRGRCDLPGLAATVKIDNVLSVRDAGGVEHYVYPYFFPEPPLDEQAARFALWLLGIALPPDVPREELRVLDVIRGQTFSIDRHPLRGNEEAAFRDRYASLLREREELARQYL
jgi:hypothetical protein